MVNSRALTGGGGAMWLIGGSVHVSEGSAIVDSATFHENSCDLTGCGQGYGGAIFLGGGVVTIRNSSVTGTSST